VPFTRPVLPFADSLVELVGSRRPSLDGHGDRVGFGVRNG
jgi:hypothetical protein